jgi:arginase
MRETGFVFVGAPADSVLRGGGAEESPARLRALGVARALDGDVGDVAARIRGNRRDRSTGIIASEQVLANTRTLRAAIRRVVVEGKRPFVAGGCCAILPGSLAGARDALGELGLAYVDGHQDLWDGDTSPTGEAADMPLSVAIGIGPQEWVQAAGGRGAVPSSVALIGPRDAVETLAHGLPNPSAYGLSFLPLDRLRAAGLAATAARANDVVHEATGRCWLHLDVDVIDSVLFPATDYVQDDGLSWNELEGLLSMLVSDQTVGVSLGCFNPEKDPDGNAGATLASLLIRLLSRPSARSESAGG